MDSHQDKTVSRRENDDGLQLKSDRAEKILVINCGSSSIKYSFYDTTDESRHAQGVIERLGIAGTRLVHHSFLGEIKRELPGCDLTGAFRAIDAVLTTEESAPIRNNKELTVVVHRVVHGGEKFTEATLITDEVIADIESLNPLAPLHNPINVAGIRAMRRQFPETPQVAVFDTSFHHTLPAHAYLYGLPYEYYKQKGVRRYGFHGTSHQYVSQRAAQVLGRRLEDLRLVSCHLGNGASLCAVEHGRSVDTSMGLTPLEGMIMGTRCGDIDPGMAAFLERSEHLTAAQSEEIFNKKSGLLGLSGVSSDMREVLKAVADKNSQAVLALETYCYRMRKCVGSYVAAMGGLDAIIFTGGVGQGSAAVRELVLKKLECMGVIVDDLRNRRAKGFEQVCRISTDQSQVAVLVVPTDEERMMAHEALQTLRRSKVTTAIG